MTETENAKLGVATRLYVRLRHSMGRVIDVVWLMANEPYAREILRISRASQDAEVQKLAIRLEVLMFGASEEPVIDAASAEHVDPESPAVASHYIGALR